MTSRIHALRQRMYDLAAVLEADPAGLALLGLGSVGLEADRLDEWSDLDFFAIVAEGSKQRFLEEPSWLDRAHPVSYRFKNTPDGYKLLFADGIFGEMAIFEPRELAGIPFAPGKVWWARPGFDTGLLEARNHGGHAWTPPSADFCLGELITCLYVGLCRYRRGERLSAWRLIQGHCLDRALELAEFWYAAKPGHRDPYNRDRRAEQRYPELIPVFESLLLGYQATPQAALNLLAWVESKAPVNQALKAEIVRLARW